MTVTVTLLKLAVIGCCVTWVDAGFTKDEADTILESLRLFKSGRCILTLDTPDDSARDAIRYLGGNFISSGLMSLQVLEEFVKSSPPPTELTAIVIKVKTTRAVKRLFGEHSDHLHWFIWFLIAEDDMDPEIRVPFNCQLFQIQKDAFSSTHRLLESYHVRPDSSWTKEFGFWTPGVGLNTSPVDISRRRRDFQGVQLKISVCREYRAETPIELFWVDCGRLLNFTVRKELRPRYKARNLDDFNGSACLLPIMSLEETDWVFTSFGEKAKLLQKFRGTHDVGWKAYAQPFTDTMWLAVAAWFLLSTAAIVIVNGGTIRALHDNAFTAFFCLCNSDPMAVHPRGRPISLPARIVYLMALAVPKILVPAYSAYVLSTLSVVLPLEPFRGVKDFTADGTYKLMLVSTSLQKNYFNHSKDPDLNYIHDYLLDEEEAPTYRALFERLCQDGRLVGLFVDFKGIRRLFRCRMFIAPQVAFTISVGFTLPKNSPLQRIFNERVTQYHEMGLKRRGMEEAMTPSAKLEKEAAAVHSLNMSQTQAVFVLLAVGVVLSSIVLAAEIALYKYFSDKREQNKRNLMYNRFLQ